MDKPKTSGAAFLAESMADDAGAAGGRDLEPIAKGRAGEFDAGHLLPRLAALPANDTGNGARFMARYGADFIYTRGLGWLAWDGRRWDPEEGERLAQIAGQLTAARIDAEADYLTRGRVEPLDDFEKRQRGRFAFGREAGNSGRIAAMVREAAPHLSAAAAALDAEPELLAVENGTLHFKQATLGAEAVEVDELVKFTPGHDRAHLMTHATPVAYDAAADCPAWIQFLEDVQPDPEVRGFLQRLVGYCLTGLNSEECLVAFEGKGANGKSVFIDVVEMLLGSAAAAIDFATLLADDRRSGSGPTPDLARLRGVRLATAGEPERGSKLAEGRIKSITGGDKIAARKLQQDIIEFRATFKLIVSWNTRPRVGGDDGIWRRILLLIWPVQILPRLPDGAPNPQWRRKDQLLAELRAELPGILNWALEGFADWTKGGLRPPAAMIEAGRSYREQSDPVGSFIIDCCTEADPMARTQASRLYMAFCAWCGAQGWEPMSQMRFGEALEERGFKKERASIVYRVGVRLQEYWTPEAIEARRFDGAGEPGADYEPGD